MIYKGYKTRVRCIDWEQVDVLGKFWDTATSILDNEKIVGLGMNWTENYFDYALGVIDDEDTLQKLKSIDFSKNGLDVCYIEVDLPKIEEWEIFKGKEQNLKEIYEKKIDCYNRKYDYELEYIDGNKNIEIKIHFLTS